MSYTLVMSSSKNSLDFELIAYIGSLYDKNSLYIIISKDKGFDAAISSYQRAGFIALRKNSIDSKTFSYFLSWEEYY